MKLNIKQDGYYSIEERVILKGGKYEGALKHDNVNRDNIIIFTEPNMQGDIIDNFNIYSNSEKPWETYIRVFSDHDTLYVNYQTKGDTVDADDINKLTQDLINKPNIEDFEGLNKEIKHISDALKGKADSSEVENIGRLKDELGTLDSLDTDVKSNIVEAINSLVEEVSTNKSCVENQLKDKSSIDHRHTDYENSINTLKKQLDNLEIPDGVDLTPIYKILESKADKDKVVKSINNKTGDINLTTDDIQTTTHKQYVSSGDKVRWDSVLWKANESDLRELESKLADKANKDSLESLLEKINRPVTWGDLKGGM